MKKPLVLFILVLLLSLACQFHSGETSATLTPTPTPVSENRCGDGVCDGPENINNCQQDCSQGAYITQRDDAEEEKDEDQNADQTAQEDLETGPASDETAAGYRRVSILGTVFSNLNTASMGDFTGIAFEYAGKISIELWFDMDGGEPVNQRNTITLTEFKDLYFGAYECQPCDWDLDESAFEPFSFELEANLTLGNVLLDEKPADELVIQLPTVPEAVIGGTVFCPCPHAVPDEFTDPSAIPVLLSWLYQKQSYALQLNSLKEYSVENYAVSPMYTLDIPDESLFYMIVDDFNQ